MFHLKIKCTFLIEKQLKNYQASSSFVLYKKSLEIFFNSDLNKLQIQNYFNFCVLNCLNYAKNFSLY